MLHLLLHDHAVGLLPEEFDELAGVHSHSCQQEYELLYLRLRKLVTWNRLKAAHDELVLLHNGPLQPVHSDEHVSHHLIWTRELFPFRLS